MISFDMGIFEGISEKLHPYNFYFYFDITLEILRYSAMECFAAKKKILWHVLSSLIMISCK